MRNPILETLKRRIANRGFVEFLDYFGHFSDSNWGVIYTGKGGGEQVDHGYKGKGVATHLLADGLGQPLATTNTGASGDERREVIPLLKKISGWLKPSMARGVIPIVEADKGYDAKELRLQILAMKLFRNVMHIQKNLPCRSY